MCSLLALLFVLLLAGCTGTEAATQVIVVVRSNLEPGRELDSLEVRILERNDLGNGEGPTRAYSLSAEPEEGQYELPLSFTVVPKQNGSRQDFRLVATGLWQGEVVVEQQAVITFVPQEALLLEIFLTRSCLAKLCRDGRGRRTENACSRASAECDEVVDEGLMTVDPNEVDEIVADSSWTPFGPKTTDDEPDVKVFDGGDGSSVDATRDAGPAETGPVDATHADVTDMASPCVPTSRTVQRAVPEVMVVLDRSASMRTTIDPKINCSGVDPVTALTGTGLIECALVNCMDAAWMSTTACGGTMVTPGVDRWAPAVSAIKSLTAMFQSRVSFGLTTFPGPETQGQNGNCVSGTVRVPVGLNMAGSIASALDATQPGGYTPTSQTLQAVLQLSTQRKPSPDAEGPPQFVLLLTDGSPNCVGQSLDNDAQAHQATILAIDALAKAGVKTFVLGYDASVDARLAAQLTEYAQHGGTSNFYSVSDGVSLSQGFVEVTNTLTECTYTINEAVTDVARIRVILDRETLAASQANGFSLRGRALTFHGSACAKLRDASKMYTPSVTVECAP